MDEPNNKKDYRVLIFTILMVSALGFIIALHSIARPYVENQICLDIALVAAILFLSTAYVMAIKGGIPPAPPKRPTKTVRGGNRADGPVSAGKTVKSGIPPVQPRST